VWLGQVEETGGGEFGRRRIRFLARFSTDLSAKSADIGRITKFGLVDLADFFNLGLGSRFWLPTPSFLTIVGQESKTTKIFASQSHNQLSSMGLDVGSWAWRVGPFCTPAFGRIRLRRRFSACLSPGITSVPSQIWNLCGEYPTTRQCVILSSFFFNLSPLIFSYLFYLKKLKFVLLLNKIQI
jgi:hypothetical protein